MPIRRAGIAARRFRAPTELASNGERQPHLGAKHKEKAPGGAVEFFTFAQRRPSECRTLAANANWWPAGSGVMRRPLVPPPGRPNPTDPGDAADLSIP